MLAVCATHLLGSAGLPAPGCIHPPARGSQPKGKFTWRGKQAVPRGGGKRTGDPAKYHGCVSRRRFSELNLIWEYKGRDVGMAKSVLASSSR